MGRKACVSRPKQWCRLRGGVLSCSQRMWNLLIFSSGPSLYGLQIQRWGLSHPCPPRDCVKVIRVSELCSNDCSRATACASWAADLSLTGYAVLQVKAHSVIIATGAVAKRLGPASRGGVLEQRHLSVRCLRWGVSKLQKTGACCSGRR